jgi:hypothetical protein
VKIEWLPTEPNPRTSGMNAAGGWRLHAVNVDDDAPSLGIGPRAAVCGLRPAHGWGFDMFITDLCTSCIRSLGIVPPRTRSERMRLIERE